MCMNCTGSEKQLRNWRVLNKPQISTDNIAMCSSKVYPRGKGPGNEVDVSCVLLQENYDAFKLSFHLLEIQI